MGDQSAEKTNEEFMEGLAEVVESLMIRAQAEQEASEPWKHLWGKADEGIYSVLNDAADQMGRIVLDLARVIQKKHEIRISDKLYGMLEALPYAMPALKDGIKDEQGLSCSSDKARHVYAMAVIAEIDRIKAEEVAGG